MFCKFDSNNSLHFPWLCHTWELLGIKIFVLHSDIDGWIFWGIGHLVALQWISGKFHDSYCIFFAFPDDGIKVWWTITLQPFDLQRLKIPLWKDLNLLNIYVLSIKMTSKIFKIVFSLSKRPYFQGGCVVRGCLFNLGTVPTIFGKQYDHLVLPYTSHHC